MRISSHLSWLYGFMNLADFAWSERSGYGTSREWRDKPPHWCLLLSFTFQLLKDKQKMRHCYQKRKIVLQIRAILINGTRGTQKWSTSNIQLFPTGINGHQGFSRIKDTKKRSKILSRKPLLNVHYTATVRSFCHCSSAGWLCPCQRGWRFTGSRKHWTARFWDGATLGGGLLGCASFGVSANEISTCAIGLRSDGECCEGSMSQRAALCWAPHHVGRGSLGRAHLGCALQRVALVYRRAKKWRSTGYKPNEQGASENSQKLQSTIDIT